MTVDHIPLPFTPIRPLPSLWPATREYGDTFDVEAPPTNHSREGESRLEPSGWPRIFPGI